MGVEKAVNFCKEHTTLQRDQLNFIFFFLQNEFCASLKVTELEVKIIL